MVVPTLGFPVDLVLLGLDTVRVLRDTLVAEPAVRSRTAGRWAVSGNQAGAGLWRGDVSLSGMGFALGGELLLHHGRRHGPILGLGGGYLFEPRWWRAGWWRAGRRSPWGSEVVHRLALPVVVPSSSRSGGRTGSAHQQGTSVVDVAMVNPSDLILGAESLVGVGALVAPTPRSLTRLRPRGRWRASCQQRRWRPEVGSGLPGHVAPGSGSSAQDQGLWHRFFAGPTSGSCRRSAGLGGGWSVAEVVVYLELSEVQRPRWLEWRR